MLSWGRYQEDRSAIGGGLRLVVVMCLVAPLTSCGRWKQLGAEITAVQAEIAQTQAAVSQVEEETQQLQQTAARLPIRQLGPKAMQELEAENARLRGRLEEASATLAKTRGELTEAQETLTIYRGRYLEP